MSLAHEFERRQADDPLYLPPCPHCSRLVGSSPNFVRPRFQYGRNSHRWTLGRECNLGCPVWDGGPGWVEVRDRPPSLWEDIRIKPEEHAAAQRPLADWWRAQVAAYDFGDWPEARRAAWLASPGGAWLATEANRQDTRTPR